MSGRSDGQRRAFRSPRPTGRLLPLVAKVLYTSLVPKHRINLNVEEDTYKRVRALVAKFPGRLSVSGLVDDLLLSFVERLEPVMERNLAGDVAGAVAMLQLVNALDQAEIVTGLAGMTEAASAVQNKTGSEVPKRKTAK